MTYLKLGGACLVVALASACGGTSEDGAGGSGGSGGTAGTSGSGGIGGAPTACEEGVTEAVTGTLANPDHPCHAWVADNYGRAPRVGLSSGGIWSRRTPHGTVLLLTAAHVLTPCWTFEPDACPEQVQDPSAVEGVGAVNLVPEGGAATTVLSPAFPLYNGAISAAHNVAPRTQVVPGEDISLFVVDSQTFDPGNTSIGWLPDPLVKAETPLVDPKSLTKADPSFAAAEPGSLVIALGYPREGALGGQLSYAVGTVLSDAEADAAIAQLAQAGDEEGSIPYDPAVEALMRMELFVGMSGGGVYDSAGRMVGTLVRASTTDIGVQYGRMVRTSYVQGRVAALLAEKPADQQAAIAEFLESP